MTDAIDVDMRDIVGPDRILPCGCHVINGAICFVTPGFVNTKNLFMRPGRHIPLDGGATDGGSSEAP